MLYSSKQYIFFLFLLASTSIVLTQMANSTSRVTAAVSIQFCYSQLESAHVCVQGQLQTWAEFMHRVWGATFPPPFGDSQLTFQWL